MSSEFPCLIGRIGVARDEVMQKAYLEEFPCLIGRIGVELLPSSMVRNLLGFHAS